MYSLLLKTIIWVVLKLSYPLSCLFWLCRQGKKKWQVAELTTAKFPAGLYAVEKQPRNRPYLLKFTYAWAQEIKEFADIHTYDKFLTLHEAFELEEKILSYRG